VAEPFVIALDGPAASGKSTVGLGAARQLGFHYLDTGLLYRALTWLALQRQVDPSDEAGLAELAGRLRLTLADSGDVRLDGRDITHALNSPEVDATISIVSAHPQVREALRPVQRALLQQPPGVIMAGRDIGTVIVPEAPLKVWLSASTAERARRRAAQTGESFDSVHQSMLRRDRIDGSRQTAPMRPAPDAIELATDGVPPEAVIARIVELARRRLTGHGSC
jgi:cytidylate kinase